MSVTIADRPKEARVSEEELQRIREFRVPDYDLPYPFKVNQFVDNARAESYRWAEEFKLHETLNTPEELQAAYACDIPGLVLAGFVDCGEKEATWAAKVFVWLTFFDDRLDDITNFSAADRSSDIVLELYALLMWSFPDDEQLFKNFVAFLDEGLVPDRTKALEYMSSKLDEARQKTGTLFDTSSPQIHPFCKALGDIWATLCESMPTVFLRRYALTFQDQLLGNIKEVKYRETKTIPPLDDYIVFRRDSVNVRQSMVAVEFADHVHIPDELFYRPEMQEFIAATLDIVIWYNDLWSFQKEALIGDVHNLLVIIRHNENCSYVEAGAKVKQMILDRIADFEKAISDLEKISPPEYHRAMSRYFNYGRCFLASSHRWHKVSPRYTQKLL